MCTSLYANYNIRLYLQVHKANGGEGAGSGWCGEEVTGKNADVGVVEGPLDDEVDRLCEDFFQR